MQCLKVLPTSSLRQTTDLNTCIRRFTSSRINHALQPTPKLPDWSLECFREKAFSPALPAILPFSATTLPPACQKWFIHADNTTLPSNSSELNLQFWTPHAETIIPIEFSLTTETPDGRLQKFERNDVQLKFFLDNSSQSSDEASLYIAQAPLTDLPAALQADLPTPELVLKAGRGDVYNTSLWMGRPPTFTPLHRDPNPNLFLQLTGQKRIRIFHPELGDALFETVQDFLAHKSNSDPTNTISSNGPDSDLKVLDESMFQGLSRVVFEELVWNDDSEMTRHPSIRWMLDQGFECEVGMGEGVFIPKGWWHSVKGVGGGMNGSVNWWFR